MPSLKDTITNTTVSAQESGDSAGVPAIPSDVFTWGQNHRLFSKLHSCACAPHSRAGVVLNQQQNLMYFLRQECITWHSHGQVLLGFTKTEAVSHTPKKHTKLLQRAPSKDVRLHVKITCAEPQTTNAFLGCPEEKDRIRFSKSLILLKFWEEVLRTIQHLTAASVVLREFGKTAVLKMT